MFLAWLNLPARATAENATLSGRVVDSQGAVVANAQVTVSTPGQPAKTTRTGADGTFSFAGIVPGNYAIRVDADGFATATETAALGNSLRSVTIPLTVAGLSEDVTVQGALVGTAATGKTTLPVRDVPLTVQRGPQP